MKGFKIRFNKNVKDLPSKLFQYVQDQVFPIKVNINIEKPAPKPKTKEMCKIVKKDW